MMARPASSDEAATAEVRPSYMSCDCAVRVCMHA